MGMIGKTSCRKRRQNDTPTRRGKADGRSGKKTNTMATDVLTSGSTIRLTRLSASNRTQNVVEQLTHSIISGEVARDSLLPPEREMAERLGVSRSVVREATKILQSRGLLTIRQGIGTVINGVTSEPVRQVFSDTLRGQDDALLKLTEVRLVLEVEIAALAAQRATADDLRKLHSLVQQMDESCDDHTRYARLDVEFHQALAAATQNDLFAVMLESLSSLLHESRQRSLSNAEGVPQQAQVLHRTILEAVAAGDATRAAKWMREHLRSMQQEIEGRLKKQAEATVERKAGKRLS